MIPENEMKLIQLWLDSNCKSYMQTTWPSGWSAGLWQPTGQPSIFLQERPCMTTYPNTEK